MGIKLLFVLVLAGLAVLFIVQNVAVVEIQFIFWSVQISLPLLMFLVLFIGITVGWFVHSYMNYRKAKSQ